MLRDLVAGPWLEERDLDGMVRLNAKFHSTLLPLTRSLQAAFELYPALAALQKVFAELRASMIQLLEPGGQVPTELSEQRRIIEGMAERWIAQWLVEGRREGRKMGEAAFLSRLLEQRFGPLPTWTTDRIATANITAVEKWSLRVLDAGGLDDVFAEGPANRA